MEHLMSLLSHKLLKGHGIEVLSMTVTNPVQFLRLKFLNIFRKKFLWFVFMVYSI